VTTVGQQLSEADIDRIARRVLELAGERIEAVAWEVIPDMAEIVVRERIREIESEAKRHEP
jgi:3-methyladenine DNA glycosylase/8-oxoguanine DNA glycosylase